MSRLGVLPGAEDSGIETDDAEYYSLRGEIASMPLGATRIGSPKYAEFVH